MRLEKKEGVLHLLLCAHICCCLAPFGNHSSNSVILEAIRSAQDGGEDEDE
jgi:hypothetical protein